MLNENLVKIGFVQSIVERCVYSRLNDFQEMTIVCLYTFQAKTKDRATRKFQDLLVWFEKEFNCMIRILRTDCGEEYKTVDLFATKLVCEDRKQKPTGLPPMGKRKECRGK